MNLPVKIDEKILVQQHNVVDKIIVNLSMEERQQLKRWFEDLLSIRGGASSYFKKVKQTYIVTYNQKIIFPVVKLLAKASKKHAWDNRKTKGRMSLVAGLIGVTFFAGQGAGIAALGGAIGVPLWIVFAGGAGLAGYAIEELQKTLFKNKDVIDVECEEVKEKYE